MDPCCLHLLLMNGGHNSVCQCLNLLFVGYMNLSGMERIGRTKLRRYLVDYDSQNSVSYQISSTTM